MPLSTKVTIFLDVINGTVLLTLNIFTAHNNTCWKILTKVLIKLPPTFCLSRIFMAKYCSLSVCLTSMTLPNEPVPRVFILSKSSRHVEHCGNSLKLLLYVPRQQRLHLTNKSGWPVVGFPISVRNLLWL